jgi:hypothetical protein
MTTYHTDLESFRTGEELHRFVNSVASGNGPSGQRVYCGGGGGHPYAKIEGCNKWTTIRRDNMVVLRYEPSKSTKPQVTLERASGYDVIVTNVHSAYRKSGINYAICWACKHCEDKLGHVIVEGVQNSIERDRWRKEHSFFTRLMRRIFK